MDFSETLKGIKNGRVARRRSWIEKDMFIFIGLSVPIGLAEILNYIQKKKTNGPKEIIWMRDCKGDLMPWVATHKELLAEDWEFVTVEEESLDNM